MRWKGKNTLEIIPKKIYLCKKEEPIKHFFKMEDGFMVTNLRFNIHIAKHDPKKQKLRIMIWLPLFHVTRNACEWDFGNKYHLKIYH